MLDSKSITEHDAVIAQHIATILCGGNVLSGIATGQQFLDWEREAFLSLPGTQKNTGAYKVFTWQYNFT